MPGVHFPCLSRTQLQTQIHQNPSDFFQVEGSGTLTKHNEVICISDQLGTLVIAFLYLKFIQAIQV
jgi:hypothetical protein